MYYLAVARDGNNDHAQIIDGVQRANGNVGTPPRAPLVKASLLRNPKLCAGYGLLNSENRQRLRRGYEPIVTRGPWA